jgi:NADH-quinone oxidoreductase subunit H
MIKTFAVYFVTILFRGALPRFRIDQMLSLNWKVLTPLSITMVFATALVDKGVVTLGGGLLSRTVVLLLVNLGIYWIASRLMERNIHSERLVVSEVRPVATANGPQTGHDGLSV